MNTTNKRILVIDDEPNILKSLQRILEDSCGVTTALGGQAALDLLTQHNFKADIILCDISMPVVNGADFYHTIAEKLPGLEKRIIFMTGGAYTDDLRKFIDSVDNQLLNKPFNQDELLSLVEKAYNDQ